jgi:inosine-uridine nucleoside N-ribohydrolase
MDRRQKILIDTDMSIDDWMAILYLLNRLDVGVIGISVTGTGVAHGQAGAHNALRLLQLAGYAEHHIPVACGDDEPGDGYHAFPEPWREAVDTLHGVSIPASPDQPVRQHAVDLMASLLENSDEPVTILAIGPLSNVAELLEHTPAVKGNIQRIYIMGGALRVKGQVFAPGFADHLNNDVTDWNSYIDPLATQRVLRSDVPKRVYPVL